MKKTQLDKLIKAIEVRETSTNGWEDFAIVPAPNQDELRIPEHPTWNCNEKGYYGFHVVYCTTRDAYTNKGGKVKMPTSERWAYIVVNYQMEGMNVTKTHTIEIDEDMILIDTEVVADHNFLGNYKMNVDMTERNWENRFAYYITYGRS